MMQRIIEFLQDNLIEVEKTDGGNFIWRCIPRNGIGSYYSGESELLQGALIKATIKAYTNIFSETDEIAIFGVVNIRSALVYTEEAQKIFKPNLENRSKKQVPINIERIFRTSEICDDFYRELRQNEELKKTYELCDHLGNDVGRIYGEYSFISSTLFERVNCPILLGMGKFVPETRDFEGSNKTEKSVLVTN